MATKNDLNGTTVSGYCIQVGPLPHERGRFVPYQSGKVPDSQDVIRWPEALDQTL
jgi:hypothetical protein